MSLPRGYLTEADEAVLLKYAEGTKLAIDLGTCNGRSAAVLSQRAERVITVDLFEDFSQIANEGSRAHYKEVFLDNPHYYDQVKQALGVYPNITVVKALTHEYAVTQNDESVDLIFFDADHSYGGLVRDFWKWFAKVKIGGMFLFHDAIDERWDVKLFCDECLISFDTIKEIEGGGSIRVFQRNV